MEEALGPENMHTVKALPSTSWHLTTPLWSPMGSPQVTPTFIAALFTIARTWKQHRCPLADEWTRKLWHKYTTEYYSAMRKNACESVLVRWVKLKPIIHSEVSQKEKHQYSILTHKYIWDLERW